MGLFSKLFGGKEAAYPALDPASAGAQRIENFRLQLESLIKKVNDRYEAVPAQNALYVFLGSPPDMFGIVWFLEGDAEEHNLKKLMAKKGLSMKKGEGIMQKLRTAYTEVENEARYSTLAAGKQVIIVPSDSFADKLYTILHVMDE